MRQKTRSGPDQTRPDAAADRAVAPRAAAMVDGRPDAITQRARADAAGQSDRILASQSSNAAVRDSPRVVAERQRIGGIFPKRSRLPDVGATSTETVQRRVGFEFESGDWRVYRHFPLMARRQAHRKEVVHGGAGFNVEADDTGGGSPLEFVTDPFDATPAGLAALNEAMHAMRDITGRLEQHLDRRGAGNGGFLGLRQHHFNRLFVELASQGNITRVKMQGTQGVALEDIPTVMRYFGIAPGEAPATRAERLRGREMMYGEDDPANIPSLGVRKLARLLGEAPDRANDAYLHLTGHAAFNAAQVAALTAAAAPLRGFLAQVILYVKGLSGIVNGNELKGATVFLQRTDFAALFGLIPVATRNVLTHSPATVNALADAVAHGASQGPIFNRPPAAGGGFFDTALNRNSPFIRHTSVLDDPHPITGVRPVFQAMGSLTIHAWIDGMTQGVDRLSAGPMNAWLAGHEAALTPRRREIAAERLESMASLGGTTDPASNPGKSRLAIFENRLIAPHDMANGNLLMAQAHLAAYNYLEFFVRLAAAPVGGNPGTYHAAPPPPRA